MEVLPFRTPENIASADQYTDPVVREYNAQVIEALENAPDGASAAAAITGLFHIHHRAAEIRQTSLMTDIRRLSSDDAAKGTMLAHVSRSVGRAHDDTMRLTGMLHFHQEAESSLHDLAGQLDGQHPEIAQQIRDTLHLAAANAAVPPAVGTVVIASHSDPRWRCGWFKKTGTDAVEAHPFAGWALVAVSPESAAQHVEAAFLLAGQWWTKTELAERGLTLERMD